MYTYSSIVGKNIIPLNKIWGEYNYEVVKKIWYNIHTSFE